MENDCKYQSVRTDYPERRGHHVMFFPIKITTLTQRQTRVGITGQA